ncbi:MAG: hypothetical protein ACE5GZ_03530 [Gammaproteobacteria bacterium]
MNNEQRRDTHARPRPGTGCGPERAVAALPGLPGAMATCAAPGCLASHLPGRQRDSREMLR